MKLRTLSVVSTLAVAVGLAAPAYAQDAATDGASRNREIVVTAEFRETALQETPIAITAVDAVMLEARGQTNIAQIAAQAPNVSLRPQPQNGGSGLIAFIRGVGQVDFNYALDPGVGVYIDDVYIPTLSSSLLELVDLDRVEILRGPQGTLAGKNAIGGAIKLFTQKPKGDGSGMLRVGYGSFNELVLRGMADFALSPDLAVRVSGMSRSRDGYVAMLDYGQTHPTLNVKPNARGSGNPDYSSMGGQNVTALRAALKWEPTDTVEINLSGDYTRERSEAIPTVLIAASTAAEPFNPMAPGRTTDSNGTPFLVGKNGAAIPYDCRFVPYGAYSCDTGRDLMGYDPRYVSYSSFMDAMDPQGAALLQAPFKPYFALPITNFNGWGVQGNVSIDLSDNLNLVYIGSYRAYNSKFGQDQDASPVPIAQLDNELNHHAFTSELRLNFEAGDGFAEGTVGAFYLDQEGIYTAHVDLNYVSPVIDFLHGPDTTPSTTKAVFGTVTLHPVEAMSITGGLRYTKDKKDYTYFRRNPDGTIPSNTECPPGPPSVAGPNCLLNGIYGITGSFKGNRLDWRLVADYRFSDQFLAYLSASTGFKGGGVNPRPFTADQRLPFNPETLTTYEFGFKSDFADNRVRLNGAAFLNKYADIILGKAVCPESVLQSPCLRPDNIGKADVWGLELEASVYPAEGLSFEGSIAYLNFKYTGPSYNGFLIGAFDANGVPLPNTNTPDPNDPVISAIPVGGVTPYTPTLTYSIGGQYDIESDAGTFSIRLDGQYQGEVFTNAENTTWAHIPGRFLANGKLTWTTNDDDWKVSVEVQNIFDKYYYSSVSDVRTPNNLGAVTGVPALPRTWALSVERKF